MVDGFPEWFAIAYLRLKELKPSVFAAFKMVESNLGDCYELKY